MSRRLSIAFGSRELWPFVSGGGIARALHGTLRLLAADADVTVITREAFREQYERMREAGDPRLPHPEVRFEFLPEPWGFELGPFTSFHHCWSARMYESLCRLYPDGGPDLVEFGDYMGEGFVTVQARRSGHPSLRNTRVLVRLHTTLEMVDALNGTDGDDEEHRAVYTLERGSIAHADHLLSPGGRVLDAYRRFYGEQCVAPGSVVPHVLAEAADSGRPLRDAPAGGPTRMLYVGRLERRKGVSELVEAARRVEGPDWRLTLVGGDTDTGPGGASMRAHLEELAAGDRHIAFHDRVPFEQVLEMMDAHHVVVIPSIWECWSNVAREALLRNRPVLATPTGALADAIRPGVSGWLTAGTAAGNLEAALVQVLDSREEIEAMIASHGPRRFLDELIDPEATAAGYHELAARDQGPAVAAAAEAGSVSAVLVCAAGAGPLDRTLRALRRQSHPIDQVVVACSGIERLPAGFDAGSVDALELLDAAAGLSDVRNAGLRAATGDLVILVDSGTELAPGLVQTLAAALQANPRAAYATAWADGIDPAAVPLGNFANFVPEYENAAAAPLFRREVFARGHRFDRALGACASRAFFGRLAADGLFGSVVPRRLLSRVRYSTPCGDTRLTRELSRGAASPAASSWAGTESYSSSRE